MDTNEQSTQAPAIAAPRPQQLEREIEAILFCAQEPISATDLLTSLGRKYGALGLPAVQEALAALQVRYAAPDYAFEVLQVAGGFHFFSKPAYKDVVLLQLAEQNRKKLSTSALETLSIVAYRQPITKAEIEQLRGVNADYTILKLLERNLIAIAGRKEGPGRPTLFSTTPRFLEHIGLNALSDLPALKEAAEQSELGTPASDPT